MVLYRDHVPKGELIARVVQATRSLEIGTMCQQGHALFTRQLYLLILCYRNGECMAMRTVEKEAEFDDIDNVELIVVLK